MSHPTPGFEYLVPEKISRQSPTRMQSDISIARDYARYVAAELVDRDAQLQLIDPEGSKKLFGEASLDKWLSGSKDPRKAYHKHVKKQFGGGWSYKWPIKFSRPYLKLNDDDIEAQSRLNETVGSKRPFLNPMGQVVWKYEDVDTYLSPSKILPRRLVVQSTKDAQRDAPNVTWRRSTIQGEVPVALRMAEWALDDSKFRVFRWCRTALVALPLQILLALPGANAPWEMGDVDDSYNFYPGYHWKWPKHAVNSLDERPKDNTQEDLGALSPAIRLQRPRQLVVRQHDGSWIVNPDPPPGTQYTFISYCWSVGPNGHPDGNWDDIAHLMAQQITTRKGLRAYFMDKVCNATRDNPKQLDKDVYTMCDVIRGSRMVAILLPSADSEHKRNWGNRLWTVPEGLLAPRELHVYTWRGFDQSQDLTPDRSANDGNGLPTGLRGRKIEALDKRLMSKTELTSEFWMDEDAKDAPIRTLAEHYDGLVTLSRTEIMSKTVAALSCRKTSKDITGADKAYALMGMLHYRIQPDFSDSEFQVVARLSLVNDSDRLVERMVSMAPKPTTEMTDLFKTLSSPDQYGTNLSHVMPRCQVVGVGFEPNTVMLSDCRAVPIRWKRFPRMMYKRHVGMKKRIAELFIRSGAWWMATGWGLAFTYAPIFIGLTAASEWLSDHLKYIPGMGHVTGIFDKLHTLLIGMILLFIGMGFLLSWFAPRAVRRLFGGEVLASAPHLVAFEGTMPIKKLEKIVFGSCCGRLRYDPSSTPFAVKHPNIRCGREPDWIAADNIKGNRVPKPKLLEGHHLFTLVDTGNLTVSVFQAKRPPTVALITGAEGGMLRAVLCSWRFADDTLYKETVIRVPQDTWGQTQAAAWIKLSLQSQDEMFKPAFSSGQHALGPFPNFAPKPGVLPGGKLLRKAQPGSNNSSDNSGGIWSFGKGEKASSRVQVSHQPVPNLPMTPPPTSQVNGGWLVTNGPSAQQIQFPTPPPSNPLPPLPDARSPQHQYQNQYHQHHYQSQYHPQSPDLPQSPAQARVYSYDRVHSPPSVISPYSMTTPLIRSYQPLASDDLSTSDYRQPPTVTSASMSSSPPATTGYNTSYSAYQLQSMSMSPRLQYHGALSPAADRVAPRAQYYPMPAEAQQTRPRSRSGFMSFGNK